MRAARLVAAHAAVAALAALATLAVPVAADKELVLKYAMTLFKGVADVRLRESLGPFYIPVHQCSGVLDSLLTCGEGTAPAGVRVNVTDGAPFPRIQLDDSLRRASVLRAPPCSGEAVIQVELDCAIRPGPYH